jgi:hypothetical protein
MKTKTVAAVKGLLLLQLQFLRVLCASAVKDFWFFQLQFCAFPAVR